MGEGLGNFLVHEIFFSPLGRELCFFVGNSLCNNLSVKSNTVSGYWKVFAQYFSVVFAVQHFSFFLEIAQRPPPSFHPLLKSTVRRLHLRLHIVTSFQIVI